MSNGRMSAAPRNAPWTLLLLVPRNCSQVPARPQNIVRQCSLSVSGTMENCNTHLAPGFPLNNLAPTPANMAAFQGLLGPGGFNSFYQMFFQQWNCFPCVAREPPGPHSVPGNSPFPPEHRQVSRCGVGRQVSSLCAPLVYSFNGI